MGKSTAAVKRRKASRGKPKKPYDDFPLFAHTSGHWAKKVRGKLHYFGAWGKRDNGKIVWVDKEGGWRPALEKYQEQRDDLQAGRTPREKADGPSVADLCNHFLEAKEHQLNAGDIGNKSWRDYLRVAKRLTACFGRDRLVSDLDAKDFEKLRATIAEKWGPVALGNEIQRIRVIFNYGYEAGLLDKPMRYGPHFKKPSKTTLRKERAARGPRMLEADEIRALLDAAGPQLRAMILLGVNCGFGNTDCGTLPMRALDLNNGWVDFPRPKTGIERRCKLWPETVEALRVVLKERKDPLDNEYADRVFVTKYRQPWINGNTANPISAETGKLMRRPRCPKCGKLNENGAKKCECGWQPRGRSKWTTIHRPGCSFYVLRHVFRTIADGCGDFPAIDRIMGHARDDRASNYRQRIDDERLEAVAAHVRNAVASDVREDGKPDSPLYGDS
jgi:integrase